MTTPAFRRATDSYPWSRCGYLILRRLLAFQGAMMFLTFGLANDASAATLGDQLNRVMPDVIAKLRDEGHRTVGVLKFAYKRGTLDLDEDAVFDAAPLDLRDDIGTINTLMAKRVEAALAIKNPWQEERSINLVRNANDVVSKIKDANHLTAEGRASLFKPKILLAWKRDGKEVLVDVDVFLSGVVIDKPGDKEIKVGILATSRKQPARTVAVFYAEKTGTLINEMAGSFRLRGGGDVSAALAAEEVRQDVANNHPAFDVNPGEFGVAFTVLYDGRKTIPEARPDVGEVWIGEAQQGQKVALRLERLDDLQTPLAVVVKVNGENTLNREKHPDPTCSKWVLEPGRKVYEIRGFYTGIESANSGADVAQDENRDFRLEEFSVTSRQRAEQIQFDYGSDVGLISATVFKPMSPDEPHNVLLGIDSMEIAAIEKTLLPVDTPNNADALRVQLRGIGRTRGDGGLIVPGNPKHRTLATVKKEWDPNPIGSIVYRYYQP